MEAKEFLVARIVEEAMRLRVALSDIERQMLYFSEQSETLPHMPEIAAKFRAEYDAEKYEPKITRLSRSAYRHETKENHLRQASSGGKQLDCCKRKTTTFWR